jgi:hypothetical protein
MGWKQGLVSEAAQQAAARGEAGTGFQGVSLIHRFSQLSS